MKIIMLFLALFTLSSCSNEYAETEKTKIATTNKLIDDQDNLFIREEKVTENSNQNYVGTLGNKVDVVFSLKNKNGNLSGFYYYDNVGIEIKLVGTIQNGDAIIYELDYQNKKLAKIIGKFSKAGFTGKWQSLSNPKSYTLHLKPTNYVIPVLPKNLVAIYKSEETACKLSINITKIKDEYFYHFISKSRNLKGKVTFGRSLEENLVYINFNGIKWAEDHNDVASKNDSDDSPSSEALPTVVQGLLNNEEIAIQNSGNAMNHYLKIGECDIKYIHLKNRDK